jgi:hypothetical protein
VPASFVFAMRHPCYFTATTVRVSAFVVDGIRNFTELFGKSKHAALILTARVDNKGLREVSFERVATS